MADLPTGAALLEAHGILEFKREQRSVCLVAGEIAGVEPGPVRRGTIAPYGVDIRMRGGGVVSVSGDVEDVREQWVAALGRLVEVQGQRDINRMILGQGS